MTLVTAPELFQPVAAPARVGSRFGLLSALEFTPEGRAGFGVTYPAESSGFAGVTTSACLDPGVAALDLSTTACRWIQASPMTVFLPFVRSAVGENEAAAREEALRLFLNGEGFGLESAFADLLAADVGGGAEPITFSVSATETAVLALAAVESELSLTVTSEGIIHLSKHAATLLGAAGAIARDGSALRTTVGSRVVVYAGWPSNPVAAGEDTIYGTGSLNGFRDAVDTVATFDRELNDHVIIPSRTYVVGYEGIAAATYPLAA